MPGTGLGLAIVQTLAQRWGGRASTENRPEGGARAEVRLPAAEGDALPKAKPSLDEALSAWLPKLKMMARRVLLTVGLGLLGVLAAASIGYASYLVSRDAVGLP